MAEPVPPLAEATSPITLRRLRIGVDEGNTRHQYLLVLSEGEQVDPQAETLGVLCRCGTLMRLFPKEFHTTEYTSRGTCTEDSAFRR